MTDNKDPIVPKVGALVVERSYMFYGKSPIPAVYRILSIHEDLCVCVVATSNCAEDLKTPTHNMANKLLHVDHLVNWADCRDKVLKNLKETAGMYEQLH